MGAHASEQSQHIILEELTKLADPTYQAFVAKLIPTKESSLILGVRTPALKAYARTLAKEQPELAQAHMNALPHTYFEGDQLHAFLIAQLQEADALFEALDTFLPHIDNWATCDQLVSKKLAHVPDKTLAHIKRWLDSDHEYTRRFAIKLLMTNFLQDNFEPEYFNWVAGALTSEYYVQMMVAWYFAEALYYQPEYALAYLKQETLDSWTHNKAIQKARESNKISLELKATLVSLKRPRV